MSLKNLSVRDRFWFHPILALHHGTTPSQMRTTLDRIRNLLEDDRHVKLDSVRVRFLCFGRYSLDVEVFAYITARDWNHFLEIQEGLLLRILECIESTGVLLTGSMVDLVGSGLPREQSTRFWQHSFLAAMLSEHLAKRTGYSEQEQAYIGGLLHDIGQVPHWMLVREGKSQKKTTPPENWFDNPPVERDYFAIDHCKLGSSMATSWNFLPSFIDVLINHHQPAQAEHDPYLVRIVGAVEHFLLTRIQDKLADGETSEPSSEQQASKIDTSQIPERSSQSYGDSWQVIAEDLETEYARLLPIVNGGVSSVIAGQK